jgi:hypothetical protein
MAIKLSEGLLSRLGSLGGTPQDARQPMGSGLLQPALSTNPLVNTLVKSIGQARGMDMRTPSEIATQAMSQIGQDDPERLRKIVEIQLQAAVRAGDTTNAAKYANVLENIKAQEVARAKLATPKVASSQTRFFKDTEGNRYARIMEIDQLGKTTFQLTPLEGSPESPVGKLSPVGTKGLTEKERAMEAANTAEEIQLSEQWAEQQGSIYDAGFAAMDEIPKLKRVLAIVEDPNFDQGGIANVISDFKDLFGLETGDVGEFKEYTASILTQRLEDFTGAISNQEREYLRANLAGLSRSRGVNARLLGNVLRGLERAQARATEFNRRGAEGNPYNRFEWFDYIRQNPISDSLEVSFDETETIPAGDFF